MTKGKKSDCVDARTLRALRLYKRTARKTRTHRVLNLHAKIAVLKPILKPKSRQSTAARQARKRASEIEHLSRIGVLGKTTCEDIKTVGDDLFQGL